MTRFLSIAATEMLILRRNRWLLMATIIMLLFALALTFAGSAPTGSVGVDMLTVSVTSMTTLSVYLAPLLALMISFDAIAGEAERGSLSLLLSYPAGRGEILLGKFAAHLAALAFAMTIGFGSAGAIAAWFGGAGPESLMALARLIGTSILLGAVFLALGYLVSALSRSATAAAGLSAGLWLVFVVLYDLGLLGAVVMDASGDFTRSIFPWLMVANPADAFRVWNISASDGVAMASGMVGAAQALPVWAAPLSLILWPLLAFALARAAFKRVEP
ncbi:nitrous oxide metabolic protein [Aliiroseovarius zhejiangensis]|uniref:Nitrous oxide metabolic protein n=1 Tax=Aliiroseovarius zhejiangensis TaxID=1632025 RepID=A0ABQ3J804_9RHOB|nr:ABC transporter permease subunit [Aliiroseovarius zhejiangensis]GHF03356.1 nitrous oxide metabolic protein [Aliiroseovarius zhejiangensis]